MTVKTRIFIVFMLMLFVLLPAACTPEETTPAPSGGLLTTGPDDTFMPILAPTACAEKAVIVIPNIYQGMQFKDILTRLNKSLVDAGVNVEITIGGGYSDYIDYVKRELISGDTKADAYAIFQGDEKNIPENVDLMNIEPLLLTSAPLYFSRYKDAFDKKPKGLPMGLSSISFRVQVACMLRQDIEDIYKPEFNTVTDVLDFIELNFVQEKKACSILADPLELVEMWAFEQGLYPLGSVYSDGYFFARMDDMDCKPVLLESVPGFYDLIDRVTKLYKGGYLSNPHSPATGFDIIGLFRNLGDYYQPDSNLMFSWLSGQYVAHELYAQLPSFYIDSMDYRSELLIPADSTAAVNVLSFVEWLYNSQDNYNMVMYGEKGVDFAIANDRLTMLKSGESPSIRSVNELFTVFMFWPGAVVFGSSDYNIVPASAPVNIDKLFNNGKGVQRRFPFEALLAKANDKSKEIFIPTAEMRPVMDKRNELLGDIIYSVFSMDYSLKAKSLKSLKNDWLLEQYADRVKKFKDSVEGQ